MKTIDQIRLDNARFLAEEIGGNTQFSEKIDRETTQVSRLIGKNATKQIGDNMARHIEVCFGLPTGWMDQNREGKIEETPASYTTASHVPVYSLTGYYEKQKPLNQMMCPVKHSPETFGILVEGYPSGVSAMHPTYGQAYPVGSIVFIDPELKDTVTSGTAVVANIPARKTLAFRMYYSEGGADILIALNPQFPPITDEFEIIGPVISAVLPVQPLTNQPQI